MLPTRDQQALQYLLRFLVWAAGFTLLLSSGIGEYLEHGVAETQAMLVGKILELSGNEIMLNGQIIVLNSGAASVSVDEPCTSVYLSLALLASILAMPATTRRKLPFALAAISILQLANILRITHLILILQQQQAIFDFVHLVLWQILMLGLACGLLASITAILYRTTPGVNKDAETAAAKANQASQFSCILNYAAAMALWGLMIGAAYAFGGGGGGGGGGPAPTSVPLSGGHPLFIIMFGMIAVHRLRRTR